MSNRRTDGDRKGRRKSGRMARILRRSIDDARQLTHPGPFRIKESPDLVAISKDVLLGQAAAPTSKPTSENIDVDFKHVLQTMAAVATAIWRVRTKLEVESRAEMPSDLRHLPRHIQAAWDALASGGFEVQDPKGQRYVPGMAVNPVTYTPESSIPPNTIVETLKPTVFWKDVLIQRADVILASPADKAPRHPEQVQPPQSLARTAPEQPDAATELPTQPTPQEETNK